MKGIHMRSLRQCGIGLLELMLALAIIAVLLIMATRYYQSTSQSQKVNQAASDIQAIVAAGANFQVGDPGGSYTIADLTKFLPSTWSDPSKINPWGGGYTADSAANGAVDITVTGIPESACAPLAALTKMNTVDQVEPECGNNTMTGTFGPSNTAG